MEPILNFAQLTAHLKKLNHRKRIAVVCANDPNTEYTIIFKDVFIFLTVHDRYPALELNFPVLIQQDSRR